MTPEGSKKYSVLGYSLKWFGVINLVGSFGLPIINVIWLFVDLRVAAVASCVLYLLFAFSFWLGKRMTTPDGETLLEKDPRPPILLLRPFSIDSRKFWSIFGPFSESAENVLVTYLSHIGPVIAVGRPGEAIPPSGAARLYVTNEEWQATVDHLMSVCRMVVLLLFSGERSRSAAGFTWEIGRAIKLLNPQQLLVMLPKAIKTFPLRDETAIQGLKWWMRGIVKDILLRRLGVKPYIQYYQIYLEQLNQELPHPLPPESIEADFVYFTPGWSPRLIRVRWIGSYRRMASLLRPFFQALNVPVPKMLPAVFKGQMINVMFSIILLFNGPIILLIYIIMCKAFNKC